ncbi:DinB family protein [Fimbriimonas ginsengisoli]|uniref:DinB-like domain-containing protein n=1 Tax=Fimbriimonas ginsengisoli Gsoil 348 TaxID=661478 RepID=A0A068NX96_FIMGI|nr:hypothetical protein [Fimbriimonas ginsengisoli]AIE86254.1 hypothetical protein OP10G_2886 [Fimbriimonas ginsengisoli Gsoil 348]
MRYQDYIIDVTRKAAEEAFRYAANVPADKLEWKPLDAGRSVLDMAREMAKTPVWAYDIISGAPAPEWDEESAAALKAEMEAWKTIDQCKEECLKQIDRLAGLYKDFPDERLSETKWLPYSGGKDFTYYEMMDYPRWNFTYHLGQIGYIQTLYGDKEMY